MIDAQPKDDLDCEQSIIVHDFKHFDEFMTSLDEVENVVTDIRQEELLFNRLYSIYFQS